MVVHDLILDQDLLSDLAVLKDDTEEDLVGTDLHQTAIRVLNEGLILAGPERGLPWHIGNQLMVLCGSLRPLTTLGLAKVGRIRDKEWRPSPDIAVHPTAGLGPMTSFDVAVHGVPPLIIEVASEGTWRYDVGAKARSYGRVGVQEYIVFDPTTEWLGTAVRAWHATPAGFVRWPAGSDGSWRSRVLDISFRIEGPLLRIVDGSGTTMPHMSEAARRLVEQEREFGQRLAEREREHARQIAELEEKIRRLQE